MNYIISINYNQQDSAVVREHLMSGIYNNLSGVSEKIERDGLIEGEDGIFRIDTGLPESAIMYVQSAAGKEFIIGKLFDYLIKSDYTDTVMRGGKCGDIIESNTIYLSAQDFEFRLCVTTDD